MRRLSRSVAGQEAAARVVVSAATGFVLRLEKWAIVIQVASNGQARLEVSTNSNALISIIDDDESVREAVEGLIESLGFRVNAFSCARDFLASPSVAHTSCMIADVHMPHMSGLELHQCLAEQGRDIPTILITAYPNESVRDRALAAGVISYLIKPFDNDALIECVRSILQGTAPGAEA